MALAQPAQAQETSTVLEEAREFYWGSPDADSIDAVQARLASDDEFWQDPIALAYVAALEILKAKHAFWPLKKLEHVNGGLPILDSLVAVTPTLVEPRYLRLLSCYFLPSMLHRQWSVDEDIQSLAHLLPEGGSQVPVTEYKKMLRFVLQNGGLEGTGEYDDLMAALTSVYETERSPK